MIIVAQNQVVVIEIEVKEIRFSIYLKIELTEFYDDIFSWRLLLAANLHHLLTFHQNVNFCLSERETNELFLIQFYGLALLMEHMLSLVPLALP